MLALLSGEVGAAMIDLPVYYTPGRAMFPGMGKIIDHSRHRSFKGHGHQSKAGQGTKRPVFFSAGEPTQLRGKDEALDRRLLILPEAR
jgi:hypothetical protein